MGYPYARYTYAFVLITLQFCVGVMLRGDMKLVVGSYSVLRRRHDKRQTVFLYNVTEDSNELFDLRYFKIEITLYFDYVIFSDKKQAMATSMMNKLAELLPEAKYPWHPSPDPRCDPCKSIFNDVIITLWHLTES